MDHLSRRPSNGIAHRKQGFTIVELLIVIVVIAILAVISVVAYNGIQQHALSSAMQSELKSATTQLELDKVSRGNYPASLSEVNDSRGITPSAGTRFEYDSDGSTYCLSATSVRSTVLAYHVSSQNGNPVEGVCDGHPGPDIGGDPPTVSVPVVTSAGTAMYASPSSSNSITVTTTASIPAGDVIVAGVVRGITSLQTAGTAVVSLGAGTVDGWTRASALRGAVAETNLLVARVATTIPAGTTVTITTSGNSVGRAVAAVAGIHNVSSGVPSATSGDLANSHPGGAHAGTAAVASTLSPATHTATVTPTALVVGFFGYNSSTSWSVESGATQIANLHTTGGANDRGLILGYKIVDQLGAQSFTANGSGSGAIAGVVIALPID